MDTLLSSVCLSVLFLAVPGSGDPCSDYFVLNEAWRNVQVNDGNTDRCDNGFAGEWYRFMEPAGTAMPTEVPPTWNRCGTNAPMWMNGQLPTLADGEVSRQACAYWEDNTCNWQATIRVRACDAGYFVYKLLPAPACNLAYCGASPVDPCSDYIVLNEAWRNVQQVNDGNEDRCDDGFAGEWYRFMEPAGTVMTTEVPPTWNRCGTDAPMWMNGQLPTLADGEVSRQACAYWEDNTCNWQATIQVRACDAGYFVYKLPATPNCYMAYCGASVDTSFLEIPTTEIPTTPRRSTTPVITTVRTTQATTTVPERTTTQQTTQRTHPPETTVPERTTTDQTTHVQRTTTDQTTQWPTPPETTVSQRTSFQTTSLVGGEALKSTGSGNGNTPLTIALACVGCAVGLIGIGGVLMYYGKRRQRRHQVAQDPKE
ncbi:uncharacterized protein LOC144903852 isoform X2 [Branchiostoma floridae x Branchiostoma belcheri]